MWVLISMQRQHFIVHTSPRTTHPMLIEIRGEARSTIEDKLFEDILGREDQSLREIPSKATLSKGTCTKNTFRSKL